MKIEYRTAGAGGAYTSLYDESLGEVSPTYEASFTEKLELSPGFGAGSQGIIPNGNTLVSLSIPLSKIYDTYALAKAGIRTIRQLKGLRLNLKVTEGTDVDYWPSATLQSMTAKLNGRAVDYVLTFSTQDVTAVEPS